ncbi:THUMP-like domain-containing protein [Lentiprolixibacter aurantiacus]|uniref:Class I SAM-dependent methyltransferase n=1 Tax=Lentiprolixibacter aurantiacus TaxID=2993939 RepID=A0AAE3MLD2_9FLAO|nr:class I SAM-dependent methyltransferase [Lentiprolixibacter aurantiacus]MCX2719900.1 class I SAM-dependent methyltransferase [Lentiprolixibacter aurantiacus]
MNADILSVILKKSPFPNVSSRELAQQITARKKSEKKLSSWFNTPAIYYPDPISVEQSSSEITAAYKARLVNGNTLADLTGGMGVDSYYFSRKMNRVSYCEINPDLAEITAHNFKVLGADNIEVYPQSGIRFLEESKMELNWIYLDPARRDKQKKRVFRLQDCEPDLSKHLPLLLEQAEKVLLKTAPLLDIQEGLRLISHVRQIHVVSVRNEVKELLWVLDKRWEKEAEIVTANIKKEEEQVFTFFASQEKEASSQFSHPLKFLYEPNAAILKAGAFKLIGEHYGLLKLHPNSHLYTSSDLIQFPGRRFRIESVHHYSKKLPFKKANIATRNFPIKANELSKKHRIASGGVDYLFFTTDPEGKRIVLACKKT